MRKILAISVLIISVLLFISLIVIDHKDYNVSENGAIEFNYERMQKDEAKTKKTISAIVALYGFFLLIMPENWLSFGERWKYRGDIEPSELSEFMTRGIGFIMMVISIFYFLFASVL